LLSRFSQIRDSDHSLRKQPCRHRETQTSFLQFFFGHAGDRSTDRAERDQARSGFMSVRDRNFCDSCPVQNQQITQPVPKSPNPPNHQITTSQITKSGSLIPVVFLQELM
jgi:hypothetical protein